MDAGCLLTVKVARPAFVDEAREFASFQRQAGICLFNLSHLSGNDLMQGEAGERFFTRHKSKHSCLGLEHDRVY